MTFTGQSSTGKRTVAYRERSSLALLYSAVALGAAPSLILLIVALHVGGSTRITTLLASHLWLDIQALCALCAQRASRCSAVLLPGFIATLMLLLGLLLFFALGPLYFWPSSVLWYVVAWRNARAD